jgi:hypothetical protein
MPDNQNQIKAPFDKANTPQSAHSDKFVTESLERAKDDVGVINANALHSELDGFTRDDWKRASELFPKRSDLPNAFYIAADKSGDFVIHNDMSEATKIDAHSVADLKWQMMKSDLKQFSGWLPAGTLTGGLLGGVTGAFVGCMATAVPEIALAVALPIGMAAGAAYLLESGDAQSRAKLMKSYAANDLETSRVLLADAGQAPVYVGQNGKDDEKYEFSFEKENRDEAKRLKADLKLN